MNLKTIFKEPVDRPIEGVIKADDEASLSLEIREYVLTNEVEKRLETFLEAYNNYEGANGVWVSGFFGSGKSHLLKMLALILENREIDGTSALELFLPKCEDNEILRGDLKKAVSIPSKSILFNIDQKADIISKTQVDALLAVFVKVFDEMCGYYGKQGHIAQFERDLDSRELYEKFRSSYEKVAGKTWEKGREQALLEAKNVAKAYAEVTNGDEASAMGILDKYRSQYRVSIEDFAEQVHAYIKRQSPEFRLNFFVDEVGQYIADNVKLMTNLQTIAESLATKCRGRAWIIVTAQEDMGTVVGEMGKQQGNDFSKIQARFANRMKLTSADVAEVIQKRLLAKTEDGLNLLTDIYHAQSNNFKTLFDFADGSQTYRNFQDLNHFIFSYPFIPYQFALFQSAIQSLSQHNAFEGKHSSVGERSMLGVFQQVATKIGECELGQLATFDLMFDGIRTTLKSNIQRSIIQAEKHLEGLDSPFAIRLLKTLFLVKYVKEFKPTVHNLCVLMLDSFDQELPALKKRVEEALRLLEDKSYIQRNGDLFEYLTDEEKDVEQEIKNTEVEASDVAAELEKIVFDQIIKNRKIRYEENGQDYSYSKKLDDRLFGREQELSIHVISPFYQDAEDVSVLQGRNMGRDELMVVMPADERLIRDLMMYKQTEKYIRQNMSTTQQDVVKRILNDKQYSNRERYVDLQERVKNLMGSAKLFVAGSEVDLGSEDAQTRVMKGFHELISRVYPNLRMLRGISYTEKDLTNCLNQSQLNISGTNSTTLAESEQEVFAFIQSNNKNSVRTTVKGLIERFERKPNGWYYAAILCTLAKLCARGKVDVRSDGNLLEDEELERALRNSHEHGNLVLDPQIEFTGSQVRALKEFYEDFFDHQPRSGEAKALGNETSTKFQECIESLVQLEKQKSQYPFLSALNPVIEKLNGMTGKQYGWYITELPRQEDDLLKMKETVIDPVLKFMSGPQKKIFDTARKIVQTQESNFSYVEGEEGTLVLSSLNDPECFKSNHMQELKRYVEVLQEKLAAQVDVEIANAKEAVARLKDRLCGMSEFGALGSEQQEQIKRSFDDFSGAVESEKLIAVVRDSLRQFEERDYQQLLSQMASWAQTPSADESDSESDGARQVNEGEKQASRTKAEPKVKYIASRALKISFEKAWLEDESDVELYLKSMREALMEEIRKGKRIQI